MPAKKPPIPRKLSIPRIDDTFDLSGLSESPKAAATVTPVTVTEPLMIRLDQLIEDTENARRVFPADSLAELATSIQANGVLEPLMVARLHDGRYEVRSGARRLRAARALGLVEVPVIITDRFDALNAILVNVAREGVDPFDLGDALTRFKASVVAERLGKSLAWVSNLTALARLPVPIRTHLRAIGLTDIRALADLSRLYVHFPEPVEVAILNAATVSRASIASLAIDLQSPPESAQASRLDAEPDWTPARAAESKEASAVPASAEQAGTVSQPDDSLMSIVAKPSEPAEPVRLMIEHEGQRLVLQIDQADIAAGSIVAALPDGSATWRLPLPLTIIGLQ